MNVDRSDIYMPHSVIFNKLDVQYSNISTYDVKNHREKFPGDNLPQPGTNSYLNTDSGFFSITQDVTTSSGSPCSQVLNFLDSQNFRSASQSKTLEPIRSSQIEKLNNVKLDTSNIGTRMDPLECSHNISLPFTCAQRTCKDLTFGYLTPNKPQSTAPVSPHRLTPVRLFDPKTKDPQIPEQDLDTTLDILESLDSYSDTNIKDDIGDPESKPKTVFTNNRVVMKPKPLVNSQSHSMTPAITTTCCDGRVLIMTPNKRKKKKRPLGDIRSDPITVNHKTKIARSNQDLHNTDCTPLTPIANTALLDETVVTAKSDLTDFISTVTSGNSVGDTRPGTLTNPGQKYQHSTNNTSKQSTRLNNFLSTQDNDESEETPYFLRDKPKRERDDWYDGRRAMAYSTRQSLRRSFLRQAYSHNLLTDWSTSNEGMPPWLQTDELNTAIFEVKAKAGREIMRLSLIYLDNDIKEHNQISALSLAKVEPNLTPNELASS